MDNKLSSLAGCGFILLIILAMVGTLSLAFLGLWKLIHFWAILVLPLARQFFPKEFFGLLVGGFAAYYCYSHLDWGIVISVILGLFGMLIGIGSSKEGTTKWENERGL